jgi:hypothetical protein
VAGSYGGQTSVTGTNIRTHLAGIYGGRFEQAENSPYVLVRELGLQNDDDPRSHDAAKLSAALHEILAAKHEQTMNAEEAQAYQTALVQRFEREHQAMAADYQRAAEKVAHLFDEWFGK